MEEIVADSYRISYAIDSILDSMGQPSALLFCENLREKFGIQVSEIRSEKSIIYVESVLRLMFGAGSDMMIRLLHAELQK